MKRRGLIVVLAGAAAWPLAGRAQQAERMRRIGVLIAWGKDPVVQANVTAFTRALPQFGWAEGKNVPLDYRFAASDPTLFETYAAELVALAPDVIFATTAPSVAALQQQTRTIPIVFAFVPDAVGLGFVQSLARPGGNITGFSAFDAPLIGHRASRLVVKPRDRGRRPIVGDHRHACSSARRCGD